jgi:phospholipid/cholesterol/gamma-HCH transport system substrate-binding protein
MIGSSPSTITVSAVFSDVGDLVGGAQVQMADIPIGSVSAITLDGSRAKVTMAIDRSAHVPDDVTAALERTTILGDQFIALKVPSQDPAPPLQNGETITHTTVVPDVEQFVSAGTQLFGSISTSQLANIIASGAQGFGGQEAELRQLLNSLSDVTAGYASRTAQITSTVNNLDQLSTSLASNIGPDAQAITNLSQTAGVLAQESGRLNNLLQALDNVSIQGRGLLETYLPQIDDQLKALGAVSDQLAAHQQDLAGILEYLPLHNATLSEAARNNFLQVFENIIVCGIPGGGESSAPAFTCNPGSGS